MKFHGPIASMLVVLLHTGCQRQPVAAISADKTDVQVGDEIRFENKTDKGDSYSWDFGDGTKSTQFAPAKTYSRQGQYSVRLVAYSKNKKKSDVDQMNVVVSEKLNAHFAGTKKITGQFYEEKCTGGYMSSTSGPVTYDLVIKAGSTDDEIILDNFGGKGINKVRAIISKTAITVDIFTFEVVPGQTLIDSEGNTWNYDLGGISGMLEEVTGCFTFDVYLYRDVSCDSNHKVLYTFNKSCL